MRIRDCAAPDAAGASRRSPAGQGTSLNSSITAP
jgi:hypothetical protein